jgi:hypothetical protein
MIRPDAQKWGQTNDDLRRLATEAPHPRTRERFLALFVIATGQSNATLWATRIGRCDECVLAWVHTYNDRGPGAMTYRRTGGRTPLLRPRSSRGSSRSSAAPSRRTTASRATAGR